MGEGPNQSAEQRSPFLPLVRLTNGVQPIELLQQYATMKCCGIDIRNKTYASVLEQILAQADAVIERLELTFIHMPPILCHHRFSNFPKLALRS